MTSPSDPIADDADLSEAPEHDGHRRRAKLGWTGWLVSGAFHGSCLAVLAGVYSIVHQREEDPIVLTHSPPPVPAPIPPPRDPVRDESPAVLITLPTTETAPEPITAMEIDDRPANTESDHDSPIPEGRPDAVAASEMGSTGAFMAIGANSGNAGQWGIRKGGRRKTTGIKNGATPETFAGVDRGLRWLKRHQSKNGMWDVSGYMLNCDLMPKCEPGTAQKGDANVALTGYALLCFLGAGYDHRTPTYRTTVKRALDYLVSVQKPDGLLGERNYEHAVAAMALAEAYGMTNDPDLLMPAQKAMNVIVARQAKDPKPTDAAYASGLGWDYVDANPHRIDSSVSGWNAMALKSAKAANLANIDDAIHGAREWLARAWKATNPGWEKLDPYHGRSRFPYTWDATNGRIDIGAEGAVNKDLACVGMVGCVFLGKAPDAMLPTLANYVMEKRRPTAWPCNLYDLYYNTYGMFQVGGEKWTTWNGVVRDMLVAAQRKDDGCYDGSFDWAGQRFHGHDTGRVLSTVYAILCLEVYYRWDQVQPEAKPRSKQL